MCPAPHTRICPKGSPGDSALGIPPTCFSEWFLSIVFAPGDSSIARSRAPSSDARGDEADEADEPCPKQGAVLWGKDLVKEIRIEFELSIKTDLEFEL